MKLRYGSLLFHLPTLLLVFVAVQAWAGPETGLDLDRKMDEATARAMLNRFGFGATPASLADAEQVSPREYLMRAIHGSSSLPPAIQKQIASMPISQPIDQVWAKYGPGGSEMPDRKNVDALKTFQKKLNEYAVAAVQERMLTMANSSNQGHEALLAFWLNHFSIYGPKGLDRLLAWNYARHIERAMAENSFESLLRASFFDPAMQFFLDNVQSTAPDSKMAMNARKKGRDLGLNENLAREIMELHTLGVGAGYTQNDVQEMARVLTGAGVYFPRMNPRNLDRAGATRNGLFLFDPRRHDFGEKHLLGLDFPAGRGLDEIDRLLHVLATQPATARHIAFQLADRFLSDTPPSGLVDAMAKGYMNSGGRISDTLLPLLASPEFARSLAQPAKFKQPVDFILSTSRAVCADTPIGNRQLLARTAMDMGEAPFMHSTPDGYSANGSDWLSPVSMAKRTRWAMRLAAANLPLVSLAHKQDDTGSGKDNGDWTRGKGCIPDLVVVKKMVGPLSSQTRISARGLPTKAQIALFLDSPEFMSR